MSEPAAKFVPKLVGLRIGLSISDSPDLAARGMGPAHLSDALVEVSRFLLIAGHSLAYGGDLRRNGFTEVLFELLGAYRDVGAEAPEAIHSYLAWPEYLDLDIHRRAELKQIAVFHRVAPPTDVKVDLAQKLPPNTVENRVVLARCLTQLRRVMNSELDARVLLGGQLRGLGRYPGLAEEAAFMMEAGKPVFLIGAFGGCAASIIASLNGRNPEAFTEDFQGYPLGRYADPNNRSIMHEGHTIYRVETTPKWNLHPNIPIEVSGGPISGLIDPSSKVSPINDEIIGEINKQKEATKVLKDQGARLNETLNQLSGAGEVSRKLAEQNVALKHQLDATADRLNVLEWELREKQNKQPSPLPKEKNKTNDW